MTASTMGSAFYRNPDGDDFVGLSPACANHPLLLMGGVSLDGSTPKENAAAAVTQEAAAAIVAVTPSKQKRKVRRRRRQVPPHRNGAEVQNQQAPKQEQDSTTAAAAILRATKEKNWLFRMGSRVAMVDFRYHVGRTNNNIGRRRRSTALTLGTRRRRVLALILTWALISSGRVFLAAHSFVWVPHSVTWAQRRGEGCKNSMYYHHTSTSLFVNNTRSSEQQRRQQPPPTSPNRRRRTRYNPAFAINKKLMGLGEKKQWRQLLELAKEKQASFNNVNYATVMSQLGRIQSFNKADPHFQAFLQSLAVLIEERGLPWLSARSAANIIHAIGKMDLRNPITKRILEWISKPKVAAHFVQEGEPQAVANVAWACATLAFEAPDLFAEIEHSSKWLVEEGKPQAVSNTAWAFATVGFQAPRLFAEIEGQSNWLVKEGKPQEVANTAWACATLGFKAPKLFAEIECRSKWLVEEGIPQAVANTAWACATLGFEAPKLFAEIEHSSKWLVEEGNTQEVTNTAWACAAVGFEAPKLFAEIESRSQWLIEEGNPQAVSNTALACAKLGYEAPKLFAEIEIRSKWLVEEGTPQAVANTAWACASLGFEASELFAEIDSQSKWLVEEGTPQDVANTAWACATLGFKAPNLFAEIDRRSKWLFEEGDPQAAANTAWACATLGVQAPKLFVEIESRSSWLVEEGTPQVVANTAWACAKLGYEAPKLFAEIEHQSKWLVEEGTPQAVANTAWACATLGFEAPELFAEIDSQSKWLVVEGKPQHIANTAWAFATLGFKASALFGELDQHADGLIEHGNEQDISNTCYAIAVLGKSKDSYTLLAKLWDKAIELFFTGEECSDEALWQLAQTQIFAEVGGITLLQIPESMAKRMELALNSREDNEVSRSSREVSELLHEIGFHHECEVAPDNSFSGGMLAIDFACLKQKVAIEFDGPSHFLKAVGSGKLTSTENGATKAKRKYLEQLGWNVINIDYRDYIQAQRASTEKQWLWELLNASGVPLPDEQAPKHETNGVAGPQKELHAQQKKVKLSSAPVINSRIQFKDVVKKRSVRFEAALVKELTERGITSVPMTKSNKPDFIKMKAALKTWALEEDNDPEAKQDQMYRSSFVPKRPALWSSIFEELNEQSHR